MNFIIKGDFTRTDNVYFYYDSSIIAKRTGSRVEVLGCDRIRVDADIPGIDKIYYSISGEDFIVSNRLKDFADHPIDAKLWALQIKTGYVPYPFTVLSGVKKALPGISILFQATAGKDCSVHYETQALRQFFNVENSTDVGEFREHFLQKIKSIKNNCNAITLVSSLSGGFDSLLLSHLFKEKINAVFHYSDDSNETEMIKRKAGDYLSGIPWFVCKGDDPIDEAAVERYFAVLDEPNCDVAGLTLFLMVSKLLTQVKSVTDICILDGQTADALFTNGRKYFKEWLMEKFFFNVRIGFNFSKKIDTGTFFGKVVDYFKSTKTRFYDLYTEQLALDEIYEKEISDVYELYDKALSNGRTNFFGIIHLLLYYSGPRIDKYKAITSAYKVKYLLPFYDADIVKLAYSVPAGRKVGYRLGKKIVRDSFPEINSARYFSRPFMNDSMLKGLFGRSEAVSKYRAQYPKYFSEHWIRNNLLSK